MDWGQIIARLWCDDCSSRDRAVISLLIASISRYRYVRQKYSGELQRGSGGKSIGYEDLFIDKPDPHPSTRLLQALSKFSKI